MFSSSDSSNWQWYLSKQLTPLIRDLTILKSNPIDPKTIVVSTLIGLLLNSLPWLPAARAETVQLGVVKSRDNQGHWSGITERLHSIGVNYCIVDLTEVKKASDFDNTNLLFLPNVEFLHPKQFQALQEWIAQGGKVIVSGPTGLLSKPDIRKQLRELLGAYWGFAMTQPSILHPSPDSNQTWVQNTGITGIIQGGTLIPADLNSTTVAVWSQVDKPPAVVTSNNATFFGWRWGIDRVAPAEVDSAWLRAALGRYDVQVTDVQLTDVQLITNSSTSSESSDHSPQHCRDIDTTIAQKQVETEDAESGNNTDASAKPTNSRLAPSPKPAKAPPPRYRRRIRTLKQATAMERELENLIGRFESALLRADAANSNLNLSTGTAIEQFVTAGTKQVSETSEETSEGKTDETDSATDSAIEALHQARVGLENFRRAVARREYQKASQLWMTARNTLWENYPTDRKLAQSEIRAIWLDRGTIVKAKSEKDLAKIFDKLATAGFHTIFFETVNASYTIYPSAIAPEQNPLVEGWDPLKAAVKLAHERGMELHAWVWIFAAANQRHNAVLDQPADYLGPVLSKNPDWAILDNEKRVFHKRTRKAFLDPANPEVRDYLTKLLEEIASNYEVDGIQLDYIRYPFQDPKAGHTFGYGKAAREQFQALTGVDPIEIEPKDQNLWRQWTDFRIKQIDTLVKSVSQMLRQKRSELIISAAVFPMPREDRLQKIQQNWEDWASRGEIDLMVPMTYALETEELQKLAQPWLTKSSISSALVLPGIRLLNLPDIVAVDQIQLLRDLPAPGYALFAVENLNDNLRGILTRTQGQEEPTTEVQVPYRQPFLAAAERYQALQQEWSFMLANNQIVVGEPDLSDWGQQADTLSLLLNRLAEKPSMMSLLSAQLSMSSFRSRFQTWMFGQSVEQPYQVQVWDNRLEAIQRLLRYGERTLQNRPLAGRETATNEVDITEGLDP
ncbi:MULTISPECIES: family 10 glycosylhydrolase [unclassified Moorena]|uniref:glycoside hydrolase family 10 protein n=1 Tax=unclassified Moorena TaxID=2683338 RepID=UPI0025D9A61E|nr:MULTISPECIES: family 10 glycosylhydrolase [unclassified Moorena]